jgi:glutathione S-transferase
MLNLYYKPYCPYCVRVLKANETIKAPLVLLDVSADPGAKAELITKGGKQQTPYLEDTDRGVAMYESLSIIEYLVKTYGSGEVVAVPEVGNVCPID